MHLKTALGTRLGPACLPTEQVLLVNLRLQLGVDLRLSDREESVHEMV